MGKYPTPPPTGPPFRLLTDAERVRVVAKLDALLFSAEGGALRPFVARCRMVAAAGSVRCEHVERLDALFRRYGVE